MAIPNHELDPNEWVIRPRAKPVESPIFVDIGKHYGRVTSQTIPFSYALDAATKYFDMQRLHGALVDPKDHPIYRTYYLPARVQYGPDLDDEIINDANGKFRALSTAEFHKGRSQGRSDDISCLRMLLPQHHDLAHLPVKAPPGFETELFAQLLRTPDLDLNDYQLRTALNTRVADAPSNVLYAGVFVDYKFPDDEAHPLHGAFRSPLFLCAYVGVFLGPRPALGLAPCSGGHRSKAYKNDITEVTKPSIAYIAMLLRFVLHQRGAWYTIESALDQRYNYFILYTEILALLEEPVFEPQVNELLDFLNGIVFPGAHLHLDNPPTNDGPGARERALARVNANSTAN